MPRARQIVGILTRAESYLTDVLPPFWIQRSLDPDFGGFLTHFDVSGSPTGETTKTFLTQVRMLYTMASAHRSGYGAGRCAEQLRRQCAQRGIA